MDDSQDGKTEGYMKTKNTKPKLGDLVTTTYNGESGMIVRTITDIRKDSKYESGYAICVDGGVPCEKCGMCPAKELNWIDSGWAVKVK